MTASPSSETVAEEQFCEALLDPEKPAPAGLVGPDGKSAPKRFNVYRNNVIVSLTEALGETFPAIRKLLGDDYFHALARAFVIEHPPESPVLIWYGKAFPGFIEAFPPLRTYPYLADVARLEWAWLQAYHAEDAPPMDPAELGATPPESVGAACFVKHPAAQVISSGWAIWDLFRANRFDKGNGIGINLETGQSVLISRPELDVELMLLRPGADTFLNALFGGTSLAEGAAAAQQACSEFSLSESLSDCLSGCAFTNLATEAND